MFFSIIQWFITFTFKKVVIKLQLPVIAVETITKLYYNSVQSVRDVGIISTIRVLMKIRVTLNNKTLPIDQSQLVLFQFNLKQKLNSVAVDKIMGNFTPALFGLLKTNSLGFSILYDFFLLIFFIFIIKTLLIKSFKLLLIITIVSIGILNNNYLNTIPFFKDGAVSVLSFIEEYTGFKLSILENYESSKIDNSISNNGGVNNSNKIFTDIINQTNVDNNEQIDMDNNEQIESDDNIQNSKSKYGLYALSIILGTVTIIGGLIVIDQLNHDLISNTPVINQIVEASYTFWDSITNVFFESVDDDTSSPTPPGSLDLTPRPPIVNIGPTPGQPPISPVGSIDPIQPTIISSNLLPDINYVNLHNIFSGTDTHYIVDSGLPKPNYTPLQLLPKPNFSPFQLPVPIPDPTPLPIPDPGPVPIPDPSRSWSV